VPFHIFIFAFASVDMGKEHYFNIYKEKDEMDSCNMSGDQAGNKESYFRTIALFALVKLVVGHAGEIVMFVFTYQQTVPTNTSCIKTSSNSQRIFIHTERQKKTIKSPKPTLA